MATSEMIQELIRAHVLGDTERFRTVAQQVAAREARAGHRLAAGKIRDLLNDVPAERPATKPTPIMRPGRELQGVLDVRYPEATVRDIVLEGRTAAAIERVLAEQRADSELLAWGLTPRRRLLFFGPPGCGKTLCAAVLAGELSLPLFRVRVETLFSRYMGETAALLAEIFEQAGQKRGVYLFDEFDSIGKHRADENDVGEARRIVSTFLQLLDADDGSSLLIAATNERSVLDRALFRRFDDVVEFSLPSESALQGLLKMRLSTYRWSAAKVKTAAKHARGLSYADVTDAVANAAKAMVLSGSKTLREDDVVAALEEMSLRRDPPD